MYSNSHIRGVAGGPTGAYQVAVKKCVNLLEVNKEIDPSAETRLDYLIAPH